ncbi:MAG: DUF1801 domain-containing protein [Bacteroidetes bacterium]|nr:DUF1801 domain-containing protein [Bacteroidota bacterium]
MKPNTSQAQTVDEYISRYPEKVQLILQKVRDTVKKAAPAATEIISYQLPAYKLHSNLVYFGAWKNHLGFYPTASGIRSFKKELSVYEGAKGSVKFPLDKPMPYGLISKIVKFRVKEDVAKSKK